MSKIIKLEDFAARLAKDLTVRALKDIDEASDVVGAEFIHDLTLHFVAHFIGAAVHRVLTDKREGTKKQRGEQLMNDFSTFKFSLQDSVAFGFQAAVSNFSKVNIDYYCTIQPEPAFKTKLPC